MENKVIVDAKGIHQLPPNRQRAATRVIEFIAANPNSTVSEIAKGTRLSEAAIRYTLIDLQATGIIDSKTHLDEPVQRGRGRPALRYVLKQALIISTPPRRFWQLSDLLISTILDQMGEDTTIQVFRSMGIRAAQATAEQWRHHHRMPMSIATFRKRLGESLNQLGYNAVLKMVKKKLIITTHNCLFREISQKYEGLVCNFHNAYYPTLFSLVCGQPVRAVERTQCMARGDEGCQLELIPA